MLESRGAPEDRLNDGGGHHLPQVAARRHIRRLRGGAQAHLLEGSDGHHYAVKFTNNPQHRRVLVNELVGHLLMRHLGIRTPPAALFKVGPEFLREFPELYLECARGKKAVEAGLHFGSRLPADPRTAAIYDFLPELILPKVANLDDFLGALVFDKWTAQTDARQAVFARDRTRTGRQAWHAWMIDNGFLFGGQEWTFRDAPLAGLYWPSIYRNALNPSLYEPWVARIVQLPRCVFGQIAAQIPSAWLGEGTLSEVENLLDRLDRRRQRVVWLVKDALQALADSNLRKAPPKGACCCSQAGSSAHAGLTEREANPLI